MMGDAYIRGSARSADSLRAPVGQYLDEIHNTNKWE